MRTYSILTGKLYLWATGFDAFNLADQLRCSDLAKEALEKGRAVINVAGRDFPLAGLALGQGASRELTPVKLSLTGAGFPLFTCPMVCTTGRVPGFQGELGYYGDNTAARSRRWVFSMHTPLEVWRSQLLLPPIRDARPAVFRVTSGERKRETRSQIYKEIQAGIGGLR